MLKLDLDSRPAVHVVGDRQGQAYKFVLIDLGMLGTLTFDVQDRQHSHTCMRRSRFLLHDPCKQGTYSCGARNFAITMKLELCTERGNKYIDL